MMAGGNWWRAYEIGCIQADYRHRSRSATVPVTMPLTLNTVSLLLPEQRWCSLRNLISPCYTRSDLAVSKINHLLQNINEHDSEQMARDLERSALAHRKAPFSDIAYE